MMKYRFFLTCILLLVINHILISQNSNSHIHVVVGDNVSTDIAIFMPDGSTVQFDSDSIKSYKVKINKTKCVQEFKILRKSKGLDYIDQLFINGIDSTLVKIELDDNENIISSIESKTNSKVVSQINDFFTGLESINVEIESRDSLYMDSLYNVVYPSRRNLFIQKYDLLRENEYSCFVNYKILNYVYSLLYEDKYMPSPVDLEEFEVRLNSIDKVGNDNLVGVFKQMASENNSENIYERFETSNILNSNEITKLISGGKYVLVNIWTSYCGPCRKFNQSLVGSEDILSKRGVEIININADNFISDWKRSSTYDKIVGADLYEGPYTKLIRLNNPDNMFPVKILFLKGEEMLNIKIKTIDDLMNL